MSLGLPIQQSEQALTAARPSRILTAFPFDYPEAIASGPAVKMYFLKEQFPKIIIRLAYILQAENKKILIS